MPTTTITTHGESSAAQARVRSQVLALAARLDLRQDADCRDAAGMLRALLNWVDAHVQAAARTQAAMEQAAERRIQADARVLVGRWSGGRS